MSIINPSANIEVWGGIECTINRVGNQFFDQLAYNDFYNRPRLQEVADLGIKRLRFPILWEKHQPQRNTEIDWSWTAAQLNFLEEKGVEVIAGLVHHGSGPQYTNLLDENFPELLAEYAGKVARQFPHIKNYTPVNEPLTTARFSGLYGLWYPHSKDDYSFQLALLNQLKGVVLAMREIRKVNPEAQLIQTEDLGKTYCTPTLRYQAKFENERRWLTYDVLCGKFTEKSKLWKYFTKKGIPTELLQFFIDNPCEPDVFGFNHYVTSERYLDRDYHKYPKHLHGGNKRHKYVDVEAARVEVSEPHGIKVLLREAWDRYHKPIAITEVHLHSHREEQVRWFKYVQEAATDLINEGVAIKALTAWALIGSYGWNKLLTQPGGDYEPGVFDLRGGHCRPTALASYIKTLTVQQPCDHHIYTTANGWWQRSVRFLHNPIAPEMQVQSPSHQQPILIIGKNGTLGKAFGKICNHRAMPYKLASREDCDIADIASIHRAIEIYRPWAIINAAGYVRVDDAEANKDRCFRENHIGAANLATACQEAGIRLVNFSSDLVFDGEKRSPYVESDSTNPLNVYGESKAAAEEDLGRLCPSALTIRTSAFFGIWDQYNFLHWVRSQLNIGVPFKVATDLYISPTYVPDLVHATLDLLIDKESGIWHLANNGSITWAELAKETAKRLSYKKSLIQAVDSCEIGFAATRPKYSVLGSERATILPSLDNALDRYFAETAQLAVV